MEGEKGEKRKKVKHIKTGVVYELVNYGKLQILNRWFPCAIYKNDQGELFVRELNEFNEKFDSNDS